MEGTRDGCTISALATPGAWDGHTLQVCDTPILRPRHLYPPASPPDHHLVKGATEMVGARVVLMDPFPSFIFMTRRSYQSPWEACLPAVLGNSRELLHADCGSTAYFTGTEDSPARCRLHSTIHACAQHNAHHAAAVLYCWVTFAIISPQQESKRHGALGLATGSQLWLPNSHFSPRFFMYRHQSTPKARFQGRRTNLGTAVMRTGGNMS